MQLSHKNVVMSHDNLNVASGHWSGEGEIDCNKGWLKREAARGSPILMILIRPCVRLDCGGHRTQCAQD